MIDDQRIRDPIHNLIKFSANFEDDKILWKLIQSRPVQRLRRIKQLGFSDFVYPGASHSRLSHSLGAMQVARRMLEVLTKNRVIPTDGEYSQWRQATLCAALLHDIGHGPYSHVFEGASTKIGQKISHEEYTIRLIQDKEISEILREGGNGLHEKTISFFQKEPGEHIFSSIISSQLDADRLDFLCRDRYFTGIRFGEIDLEWLFDSLRVENMPIDLRSEILIPTFVISAKGLSVAVEYLASYSHMYSSVYFHKTTRGIEVLVSEILMKLFQEKEKYAKELQGDPIFAYFNSNGNPELGLYLSLDDSSILSLIKRVAMGNFDQATDFAQRFLARKLFKCFEPPKDPKEKALPRKIGLFRKKLNDNKIHHYPDITPPKGYKQFDVISEERDFLKNILVSSRVGGEPRPIGELNRAVLHFADQMNVRFYFLDDAERKRANAIWDAL